MRVLVTGHEGYIGVVMCELLSQNGHDVVGLDTGYFNNNDFDFTDIDATPLVKDIRDIAPADLEGIDAVIHLAALSNDPMGDLKKHLTDDINHHATLKLAKIAKNAGVSRFVYASSCSLYGVSGLTGSVTEDAPLNPLTAYAISKVRCEEGLSKLAGDGFSPTYMRNATAFGLSPRLRLDIVVNNLTAWAATTGKIKIMSDGSPWRPLVHIRDISQAALTLMTAPVEKMHDQPFNIGLNSENYRVREIAEIIGEIVPGCEIEFTGEASPDQRSYQVDFDKFHTTFPDSGLRWTVPEGVRELYDAFVQHDLKLADFEGSRYIRLKTLQDHMDSERLDNELRWA